MAEEASTGISVAKIAEITESQAGVFESLVEGNTNAVLPEHIFIEFFLPYFAGTVPIENHKTILGEWVSVAGTPMNEVDIIDAGNRVLFTVPAVFNTSVVKFNERENGESLADIFNEYNLRTNNIPAAAEKYLGDALSSKVINPEVSSDQRWMQILERYGYSTVAIAPSPVEDVEDDLDYGD